MRIKYDRIESLRIENNDFFREEWSKTNRNHIIKVNKILIINVCALHRRHSVNKNKGYPNKFEFQINENNFAISIFV